jgi:hypothetical protein
MSRERRRLFHQEEPPAEPGQFGCPMLVRAHRAHPVTGTAFHRCQLGWGLHDEIAVARCSATEAVTDCWKAHPERTPLVMVGPAGADDERIEHKASAD